MQKKSKYSYRFLFIPETIGAITWLSRNEAKVRRIKYGLVVTCVGDDGNMTYKKSRHGDANIDKAVEKVLSESGEKYTIRDFFPPGGSDERQFGSLGFDLPVGCLMRSVPGLYSQYHTSADNLDFISAKHLNDSFEKYMSVIRVIENDKIYLSLNQKCEPQLGRRGLYNMLGGCRAQGMDETAIMWLLNMCDGRNSILDISIRSGLKFDHVKNMADALVKVDLLKETE